MTPVAFTQTEAEPVMVPAAAGKGFTVTAKAGDAVPFPQLLVPATVMLPDTAVAPKLTVMLFVPAPVAMVAPAGRVHV